MPPSTRATRLLLPFAPLAVPVLVTVASLRGMTERPLEMTFRYDERDWVVDLEGLDRAVVLEAPSPMLRPLVNEAAVWLDASSFLFDPATGPVASTPVKEKSPLPLRVVGDCAIGYPVALAPWSASRKETWRSVLRVDGGELVRRWPTDATDVVVSGSVAAIRSCRSAPVDVVAVTSSDVDTALEVLEVVDRAWTHVGRSRGKTSDGRLTFVVASELDQPRLNDLDAYVGSVSNLLLGPFPPRSAVLANQVMARLLLPGLEAGDRVRRAGFALALADRLRQKVFGGETVYASPTVEDKLLFMLPDLDRALEPRFSEAAESPQFQARMMNLVYAPLYATELTAESLSPEAGAPPFSWEQALSVVQERLSQNSGVVEEAFDQAEGLAFRLAVVGSIGGFLEDCGCKTISAGGLKRLLARWEREGPEIRVSLGQLTATPHADGYASGANDLILDMIRDARLDACVPGSNELYLLACGQVRPEQFSALPLLAANLRPRSPALLPRLPAHVDVETEEGVLRIVGIVDIHASDHTWRELEWIDHAFDIRPPLASIAEVLEQTPEDVAVVFVGRFLPASLPAEGLDGRKVLFVAGKSRVPRTKPEGGRDSYQVDGRLGGVPILFDATSGYGIQHVAWSPETGSVGSFPETLMGDVPPNASASIRIREFLEGLGDDQPVELVFDEPLLAAGSRYVGSSSCAPCHRGETEQWVSTPHASAMSTLERAQRHRVRNCVSCHVVGFEKDSGYHMDSTSGDLENVGCEVCHGPGSRHLEMPSSSNIRRTPGEELCASCHTSDHSELPNGRVHEYFARIDHGR